MALAKMRKRKSEEEFQKTLQDFTAEAQNQTTDEEDEDDDGVEESSNDEVNAKTNATTDSEAGKEETESDEDEAGGGGGGNAAWADSIANVLKTTKPAAKKTLVLSRAKKIVDQKVAKTKGEKDYDFEVVAAAKVKQDETAAEEIKSSKQKNSVDKKTTTTKTVAVPAPKKNIKLDLRIKPTWKDIERERGLRKIATKGVVQLFNAVRVQQKDLEKQLDEAGPLSHRKEAVLNNINKRKFLDVLMSGKRAKSEAVDNPIKNETGNSSSSDNDDDDDDDVKRKKKSEWNVFRADFLTNKKIKHWDEEDAEANDGVDADNVDAIDDDESDD